MKFLTQCHVTLKPAVPQEKYGRLSTPCLGSLSEHVDWTLMVGRTCKMYGVFWFSILVKKMIMCMSVFFSSAVLILVLVLV